MKTKPVIGILGGIGSGKSTVAAAFADLGCVVVDADVMAHELLDEPDVSAILADRWGMEVLDAAGHADRRRIAEKVFGSQEELDFLQRLIHPHVLKRSEAMLGAYQTDPNSRGIVLDMPLLLEVGWDKKCDFLVFVDCSEAKRRERIAKNAKIDIQQLKKRGNFQIFLDKKKQKAHYVINNNSDKSDITEQVALIFSNMTGSRK
ncbi:MAG: dephospho-CoA kinase [Planctomycetota bacterium]